MLFDIFFGLSVFLLTNLSLLYASHLLVRRFVQQVPPPVRLTALGTCYYAFIILIFQALSPFHAISKTWVTITCIAIGCLFHFLWGKHRDVDAEVEPLKLWLRDGLRSRWAVLIMICGFVVLLALSRALLMPPLAWDSLTYHLTFATLWLKKGTLVIFKAPDQIAYAGLFPINGELFASWLLLPFGTDLLINTLNFPIFCLGILSCYAIARELGLTRKEAAFAPALIFFAPVIYVQITTEYLDIATLTFCSASVLFTLRYLRNGRVFDYGLALVAVGILLGLKYNAIPAVGLIVTALVVKSLFFSQDTRILKKICLVLSCLMIVVALGGRQYIVNIFEANNPLYPFPVKLFNQEVFEGSLYLEQVQDWINDYEKEKGWDKFSLWEKEYRKFCYVSMAAGPKFLIFLVLAGIALFFRPRHLSRGVWLFFSLIWILPIILFYANTTSDFARRAYWTDGSFRFLSPYIAFLTIQSLIFIKRVNAYTRAIDFIFIALVAWDILQINKIHLWEVSVTFPLIILMVLIAILLLNLVQAKSKTGFVAERISLIDRGQSGSAGLIRGRWVICAAMIMILGSGLYLLQGYRDTTRYVYYRRHNDLHSFPRNYVDAWEFLDQLGEKKTIALAMDWNPPSHHWFFYPLFGRWLQNDIEYLSAKNKWEVPTWVDRGMLRGKDYSIWLYNLKRKKVDCVLVQKPWPIEAVWMDRERELFQLVFSNQDCKIFKYTGSS